MKTDVHRRDAYLVLKQLYYEQLSFWKNPVRAVLTVGFSVIFLVFLAGTGGSQKFGPYHLREVQYYVPGFAAYGIMSACFTTLAISIVTRRETGLLKRLRLSPVPTWVVLGGVFLSSLVVSVIEVVLLLAVGRLAYHVMLPHDYLAFSVAVVVGVVCFTALGVGVSTFVPNQDSGAPVINLAFFVVLFLSGLYFPLKRGSALQEISAYFPVERLIVAMFQPFQLVPGLSPWDWSDLGVVAIWGVVGAYIALRRFRFEPWRESAR